jgi:hypothetical protein
LRLASATRGRSASQACKDAPARRRAGKPQPAPSKARRKTLVDLTNECCRWPYGELGSRQFFFCGAPGADVARGIAYCAEHMQRAYIVPPSLIKPLRRLIARGPAKLPVAGAATSRSVSPQRQSKMHKFG